MDNGGDGNYKIIVFFVTARLTQLAAEVFNHLPGFTQRDGNQVLEMHSRKSQAYRTRVSQEFRDAPRGIMFSSGRVVIVQSQSVMVSHSHTSRSEFQANSMYKASHTW